MTGSPESPPRRIAVLPGDGVGAEVTRAAVRVLDAAARAFGLEVEVSEHPVGWAAVQAAGSPLPAGTREASRAADAVFLGAVGHPDADGAPPERRPEAGLLALRTELGCYINLRPLKVLNGLAAASPLETERVRGVDFVVVRELAGGLYYGEPRGIEREGTERVARNTLVYREAEIERIAEAAFRLAADRRGRVTSVDKANVLETSRLWREVVDEVAARHPRVEHEHMLVDRAAMELVTRPRHFDVILTDNLFGDILSDEAAGVAGSLGLLPSASLGGVTGLFEPVHGSAPDLAGRDVANPIGAILSMAMLLEHGVEAPDAARAVERSVEEALEGGLRTVDLVAGGGDGEEATVGTGAFAEEVARRVAAHRPASSSHGTGEGGP